MPSRPTVKTLVNSSADILNAIRNSATINYKNYVPVAEPNSDSIREIGAVIMAYPTLQNEFLNALVNRIGRVLVTSKMYDNPLAIFKQGMLEFGETIEEIFVNIAKPFEFDPNRAESELFKREIPDVRAAFHIMNYQKFYKTTISNDQLRQAFLSIEGVTDLIAKIVDAMYTGANYDEFQTMKYMLAKNIINGKLYPQSIDSVTTANMKSIVADIKSTSNKLEFMSSEYNIAGVKTHTIKSDQYILLNADFDAKMDVEVLASAFNMDKAEFLGRRVLVDGFGELDIARLNELFAEDPSYEEIGQDVLDALNTIPAIIVDKSYFMIFDNYYNFTETYNGQGLYWNYFYHTWKTFSVSPFANAVMFVTASPAVTSVEVTPASATASAGTTLQLSAKVTVTNFAPQDVVWSSNSDKATVSSTGVVTIGSDAVVGDVITITATSVYDGEKFDTCTITIG